MFIFKLHVCPYRKCHKQADLFLFSFFRPLSLFFFWARSSSLSSVLMTTSYWRPPLGQSCQELITLQPRGSRTPPEVCRCTPQRRTRPQHCTLTDTHAKGGWTTNRDRTRSRRHTETWRIGSMVWIRQWQNTTFTKPQTNVGKWLHGLGYTVRKHDFHEATDKRGEMGPWFG